MSKADRAGNSPMMVELEENKVYAWCACGKSNNQPWCNGSHSSSDETPHVFRNVEVNKAAICLCKQTSNPPFCDGSHSKK